MTSSPDNTVEILMKLSDDVQGQRYLLERGEITLPEQIDKVWVIIQEAKQSLDSHYLSIFLELVGEDEKEFTKRSRAYEDSDTDKLWDLANGIEPISSSQISTWGGSANTQFRKFALKLRNTIWKEVELHNNELRAELRTALQDRLGGKS